MLMSCQGNSDSTTAQFWFNSDSFMFGVETANLYTSAAVFRDASAWYHVVFVFDSTNATAADRMILYINNTRQTASTYTTPTLNADYGINRTVEHNIGRRFNNADFYFDGYLADIHFIDGQALDPTSFGEFDANGIWQPIDYTGSFGTNGFHLPFDDNSTAAALGTDSAGSNDWTVNNLSVTAGAGNDSLVDVPTNGAQTDTGAGGEVRGNYAVLNPLSLSGTLTNGNLDLSTTTVNAQPSTFFFSSGKWYWETTISSNGGSDAYIRAGVCNQAGVGQSLGATANGWCFLGDGRTFNNGSAASYGVAITTGDVLNIALDIDAGKLWYGKNGTWMASGNPATGANPSQTFTAGTALSPAYAAGGGTVVFNFNAGQRPFAYTAPSGFKALNTANLPAPTIEKPSTVMDVVTYTGTGSTLTATSSLGFSPDLVWIKSRSAATDHTLYDVVRGAQARLESNNTDTEVTSDNGLTAFNSNGFTLGTLAQVNTSSAIYAGWCWDAGSSTVTNNTGTITGAQVRANASAGTSVVAYTGNGTSGATVGHGLGAAPGLIIVKKRSAADDWVVYHSALGATKYLWLHATNAEQTGTNRWNDTAPTSTVFSLGNNSSVNGNASTFIAYCFAPVSGYSSFGSYTGNGVSGDGVFVYTGMCPRFMLIKRTDTADNWVIWDTARETYNPSDDVLLPNSSGAEATGDNFARLDILSNGFKLRNTSFPGLNGSGASYVYAAFAESPFQYARAR
jgi:hypothetical protein